MQSSRTRCGNRLHRSCEGVEGGRMSALGPLADAAARLIAGATFRLRVSRDGNDLTTRMWYRRCCQVRENVAVTDDQACASAPSQPFSLSLVCTSKLNSRTHAGSSLERYATNLES